MRGFIVHEQTKRCLSLVSSHNVSQRWNWPETLSIPYLEIIAQHLMSKARLLIIHKDILRLNWHLSYGNQKSYYLELCYNKL